jgi:phosphate starvation-inducible protein PhoH and related proteins
VEQPANDYYEMRAAAAADESVIRRDTELIIEEYNINNHISAQMKMFLTRIGFGSKVVITGDLTQKDLPHDQASGLDTALRVLRNVEEIGICRLTSSDVVRHPLVQKIVKAYDEYENRRLTDGGNKTVSADKSGGPAKIKRTKADKQKK